MVGPLIRREAPVFCVAYDISHRVVEMDGEYARRPVFITREEFPPRLARHFFIDAADRTDFGLGELNGIVKDVARDDGVLSSGENMETHVSRRVAMSRLEPEFVGEAVIHVN